MWKTILGNKTTALIISNSYISSGDITLPMHSLLILHGAIGANDQLQALADALKDKCIVHTLNFSGHGGIAFPEADFSIPLFAGEVLKYLQQNKIERVNIFGYSMGGYVAIYLAKHHPALVGKIITLATKFYWDEAVAAKEVKMLDAEIILQKVPAFAEQLRERHLPNDWKTVLDKTKEMLLQLGQQNALQLNDYATISADCLLLLGDKDKMVTIDETIAVQKALPNGSFRSLPDTQHPIEQVNTTMLASVITDFLH